MKSYNLFFTTNERLKNFIKKDVGQEYQSVLVQIFSGIQEIKIISEIISTIKKSIPNAIIIGTSTAGEIYEGAIYEERIVISFSLFEKTKLSSYSIADISSEKLGGKLGGKLIKKETKAIILFADGIKCNGEAILKGIKQKSKKNVIISGGMAGDNSNFKKTFLIDGEKIFENGAVAVALSGKDLIVNTTYNLSWKPIGIPLTITKADKNIIYEIDNKPVKDIYKEYFGEDVVKNLPDSAIEFPLVFEEDGLKIARSIIAVENETMIFAGEIKEGTKVRFAIASTAIFDKESQKIFQECQMIPAESIFVYSCIARKTFLGKNIEMELKPLSKIAPTVGFFTYGELYSGQNRYEMLNITSTLLVLSENKKIIHKNLTYNTKKRLSLSTTALIHLVDNVISKLERESNEKENTIANLNQYLKAIEHSYIVSKTDTKGYITYANENFCKMSGYTKNELMGKPHNIVRHPDVSSEIFRDLWQTIKAKEVWQGNIKNLTKDGKSYYVDATIFPILDKDNNITEYVAIRNDFTELEHQKQRAEAIFNFQDNIVLLTQIGHQAISLNKKFFELFNYKDIDDFRSKHECICELFIEKEEFIGREIDGESWIEHIVKYQDKTFFVAMMDKEERERIFSLKAREIKLELDEFIICSFSEVTELVYAKEKALEAKRAKDAFLSTMSHELRTPLNSIIGFSQILIRANNLDVKQMKNFIEKINVSGNHLLNLVNNILDFSKMEANKMNLQIEDLQLKDIFKESATILETIAHQKSININIINMDNAILKGDKQLLKQVFINIMSNAIKFSPVNSKVLISYDSNEYFHIISICDEGLGIPKEQLNNLFQPFVQVGKHKSSTIKGTGLGLVISKKIMELHSGYIKVRSEINKGSCFDLYFPKGSVK